MELRHLRYFSAVAETLHFGRAARQLNLSQPALSRRIQELEAELGFRLFQRNSHQVTLSAAGAAYLVRIRRALIELERARQAAAAVARGQRAQLRIGRGVSLPAQFLSRVIAAFAAGTDLHIDILEAPIPPMLEMLRNGIVDVAFVMPPATTNGLVTRELMRTPLLIALPADHPLAAQPQLDLAQLAGERFVVCRRYEQAGFRELVEQLCLDAGFTPRVLQAVEHGQTTLELVAAGLGVSIIPATQRETSERIRYSPFRSPAPQLPIAVAWREDTTLEQIAPLIAIAEREAAASSPALLYPAAIVTLTNA